MASDLLFPAPYWPIWRLIFANMAPHWANMAPHWADMASDLLFPAGGGAIFQKRKAPHWPNMAPYSCPLFANMAPYLANMAPYSENVIK